MLDEEYESLFRLLNKLKMEAPCENGACVGQRCDYLISGCYGDCCPIDLVREEAESRQYWDKHK